MPYLAPHFAADAAACCAPSRSRRSWLALLLVAALPLLSACAARPPVAAPGYEVFLLVGQSNMSGRGVGADPLAGVADEPRLLMWDAAAGILRPARDPLPQQDLGQRPVAVGPGVSFGRARLAAGPGQPGRIVLVPAAFGGTGFSDPEQSWRVTGAQVSPLTSAAVARANAAMQAVRAAAADDAAPVRFAGILWHQGETDGGNGMRPDAYQAELTALAGYLRSHIDGAGPATPFVVGQYVPSRINASPALAALAGVNRSLPASLAYSACAGSAGLSGNPAPDTIHFDAASQRSMGRRYAAALLRAQRGQGDGAEGCDW